MKDSGNNSAVYGGDNFIIEKNLLKSEEKAIFALRSLYKKYGYLPYNMSKFEEYELYIRNKDFLVSDRIITFNDTNGKLMALKPDVTLSIIKSGEDTPGFKQKVYYNENVYRVSESTKHYKEIMQTGLECIGDIDGYDVLEVILLAAESLDKISSNGDFVLEISHLGILFSVIEQVNASEDFIKRAAELVSMKNMHDLKKLCDEYEVSDEDYEKLCVFITSYGERKKVLNDLKEICRNNAEQSYLELCELSEMIDAADSRFSDKIIFDFSVVNDMNYYNSIAFRGFIDGISDGVLSGGRYDKLMKKMGRKTGAIGFAVYTHLLEQLKSEEDGYDIDVLLVYDEKSDKSAIRREVEKIVAQGKSVSAQKTNDTALRYREKIIFGEVK